MEARHTDVVEETGVMAIDPTVEMVEDHVVTHMEEASLVEDPLVTPMEEAPLVEDPLEALITTVEAHLDRVWGVILLAHPCL